MDRYIKIGSVVIDKKKIAEKILNDPKHTNDAVREKHKKMFKES